MKLDAVTNLGLAAVGLAAVLTLSACAGASGSPSPTSSQPAGGAAPGEPATHADLVGAWVTGESYAAPDVPFLDLADDGTWTGSDGCNGAQGEWAVAADGSLTVSAGLSTLIACDGVALPALLENAALAFVDGESLVLADAAGAPVVTLVTAPEGTVADAAGSVIGTWSADAPQGAEVFLTFTDGKVTGKDGCNNLMGSWSAGGSDSIVLSGLGSTMMYCDGVDTWLSKAVGLTLDGATAVVVDETGAQIGILTKQG